MNTYFDKTFMQSDIKRLPYDGTGTNTNKALEYLRTTGFTGLKGARARTPKLAIIVTDGQSNYPRATEYQAIQLKKTGVRIFVIGVGSKVDNNELNAIATSPKYVFKVKDYEALKEIKGSLESLTCEAILLPLPTVVTTTTTTEQIGCGDVSGQCEVYGRAMCSDYAPWAKDNCACYCGFCPCTTKEEICRDVLPNCAQYEDNVCIDPAYRGWVLKNCRAFCRICDPSETTTPMTTKNPIPPTTPIVTPKLCADNSPSCKGLDKSTCTDPILGGVLRTNCEKSCGVC